MPKKSTKKKDKTWFIVIIIVILCGLGYYSYKNYGSEILNFNKSKIVLKDDLKVEINEECKVGDFIKEVSDGTVVNNDDIVDTSKLGKVKINVIIKNKKEEETKSAIFIEIIDTKAPVIEAKEEVSSYIGDDINLSALANVSDNSKEELTAKVIGDYNVNEIGSYSLKYEAVDSSGNKSEYDFILNIVNDPNNRTFTTSKGYTGKVVNGVTYIDGVLIANKTYSLPSDYGSGLTWETQNAFNEMNDAFNQEKVDPDRWLWIASGYRSYWDQSAIYNNYVSWDGQANADTYSARPGHSEHQTGLAFDLNTIEDSFSYTEEGKWVHDNCYRFGLILRYPLGKESITGYIHESWHMRYVGVELATKLYNGGDWITLEEYYGIDSKYS